MKTDRCGLDRIEHWILATLPSVVTIPIKKDDKEFVIYVSVPLSVPTTKNFPTDKELQDVSKEIADRLEFEPAFACG